MSHPKWLEWGQKLQAIAQNGISFTENPFDIERYKEIRSIAANIIATYSDTDFSVISNLYDSRAGYMTPKVDVRGVVFQDEKILLVKEKSDGGWTLPGGWVDVNEAPGFAVEREVSEEAGYTVKAIKLLAVYDRNKHGHPPYIFHLYKLFFLCELIDGKPISSIETEGADFFEEDQIPPLSLPRTTSEEINRMFVHLRNPDLPTEFD